MAHSSSASHDASAHAPAHAKADAHGHGEGHGSHHVVTMKLLTVIFVVLMVLTYATVAATKIDLGYTGNLALALAIAVVKAVLVMLYFMHLRWDAPFNTLMAVAALLFIAIFIVATITDSGQYKGNLIAPVQPPGTANVGQGALLPR